MKTSKNEHKGTEETEEYPGIARLRRLDAKLRRAHAALCKATAEEFPLGAIVEVTLGRRRIEAAVVSHVVERRKDADVGMLVVKNLKTGGLRWVLPVERAQSVRVIELPAGAKPTTNERI